VVRDALMAFCAVKLVGTVDDHFHFEVRYRVGVGLGHHVCMHACMGCASMEYFWRMGSRHYSAVCFFGPLAAV
jgi:hypothetical protein